MKLFARKDFNNNYQLLSTHIESVESLASLFADEFSNIAAFSGRLHDIGKASHEFQQYLIDENRKRGSVIHSHQGALFSLKTAKELTSDFHNLAREILAITIAAHHGKLSDAIDTTGENVFFEKILSKSEESLHYDEILSFVDTIDNRGLLDNSAREIQGLLSKIKANFRTKESSYFALGLFVKYLFSCLIDADRLDAYFFDTGGVYLPPIADWEKLTRIFENKLSEFKADTSLNKIRAEISQKCKEAGSKDTGIYRLSVPTGGGKTLASLRFALHHAMQKDKKRIIYVIPYLSITTQTATTIRDFLQLDNSDNIMLEHHSAAANFEDDEDDLRKLTTSRWDNPIVVTTMVQFLETIMSARGSDLRKFHNMQDSVIIFDEIQSLPVNCIHLFNEIVSFLSKILNTTILLCTATQPLIDKTNKQNLLMSENPDLIADNPANSKIFKRTNIVASNAEKTLEELSQIVFDKANENGNCLCVVNLKSQAREIYKTIKQLDIDDNFSKFHLSTAMCSAHRRAVLRNIRQSLLKKEKVICISTQLIEAGVDISFSCVIRAMAGLDSVLQAAGRCNRNGESFEPKNVYIYPIKDEKGIEKLNDVKKGKEITKRIINEYPDADYLDEPILQAFYRYYFYDRFSEMDYMTKDGSVYDMLSANNSGKDNYKNRTGAVYGHFLSQAFTTASDNFSVIPDYKKTVVVYYDKTDVLLDGFANARKNKDLKKLIGILNELQSYSVSFFDYDFKYLDSNKAIFLFDKDFGIYVLNKDNYSDEYGVERDAEMQNLII